MRNLPKVIISSFKKEEFGLKRGKVNINVSIKMNKFSFKIKRYLFLELIIMVIISGGLIFIPNYSFGYDLNGCTTCGAPISAYTTNGCGTGGSGSICYYDSNHSFLGCNYCTTSGGGTASPTYQCNDGIDNDSNGLIDYPADLGCSSSTDNSESGYIPPPTQYAGSIYVSSNLATQWNIFYAGVLTLSGSGTSWPSPSDFLPPLREGTYTISWGNISGYTTPASQSLYLNNNSSIIFYGDYAIGSMDIGLRLFDGSQTIKIAIEPTGTLTSPLRIAKNGIVYGIALVDISDPRASKMRVKTSSGIKAIMKI